MNRVTKAVEIIEQNPEVFLHFLKATFPLFHNSNIFFRDIQYGLKRYLEKKNIFLSIADAEKAANNIAVFFKAEGIFVQVNDDAYRINFPEFVTKVPGDPL